MGMIVKDRDDGDFGTTPGLHVGYYCDNERHLVCIPYSVENLHRMAADLGLKRCWFHRNASYPHYDIPKRRIAEIQAKCVVVTPREILAIVKT